MVFLACREFMSCQAIHKGLDALPGYIPMGTAFEIWYPVFSDHQRLTYGIVPMDGMILMQFFLKT
jgi:hypothetical protein